MAQLAGQRHALVTSETRDLATARTRAARVRTPAVAVTAEDVTLGKPNPEVFLTAARLLRVDPAACEVEDSTNAIAAGLAAGMRVIGVGPHTAAHHRGLGRRIPAAATDHGIRLTLCRRP